MTQPIRINGQRVHGGVTVRIGVQRDNDVRRLVFQGVPTIGDAQTVTLLWVTDKVGAEITAPGDIVTLERVEDGYAWDVLGRITQYAGRTIRAYLQVTLPDGREWHTEEFRMSAFALPDIEATASDPTYTSIEQFLAAIALHRADMTAQERRVEDMVTEGGSQLAEVEQLAGQVREDAQGVESDLNVTHGYMERAETAADGAEDSAEAAAASAGAAEAIYTNLAGLELSVDVENGTLNLFGDMAGSVIDIALNERNLEVYKV